MKTNDFDCIVIGAGHAGIEAAFASARIGAKTALVTISKDSIARMSCNPAIGGLAKGQIAREVDALGGLMGLATDATGIQFRMLNRSKGPAVQSPRAQVDKYRYAEWMRQKLEETKNLTIVEAIVSDIVTEDNKVKAVVCKEGTVFAARTVIIATGTFLSGLMHIGDEQFAGGRLNEPASIELSDCLRRLGFKLGRLKTGTPPRLDAATIDFDKLEVQPGDEEPCAFSFLTDSITKKQIPCWITYTNEKIHKLISDNLDRAPLYTGQIKSIGPRYCPSIETKIVRFADKNRHQIFLEPEQEEIKTIYCNGISTSLPKDVQEKILKLMSGTEKARIVHYGYAIEYDYSPPIQLQNNLESKKISGLFFAGQINGTSGYEEAAGQGIIAGINATRKLAGSEPVILGRSDSYIGVLIDDLLTKEMDEPYRMFTSRAEYRLSLRSDNADRRLTPLGRAAGLVDNERWKRFEKKLSDINRLKLFLQSKRSGGKNLWEILSRPKNSLAEKLCDDDFVKKEGIIKEAVTACIIDAKYEGYLDKQNRLVKGLEMLEKKKIPLHLDYSSISHLRAEAMQKLSAFRPATLGQAARIGGITPADIVVIQVHLKKYF